MKTVGSLIATSALVAEALCVAHCGGSATAGQSAPRVVIVPDHPQRTIALRAEQLASINRLDARAALRRLPAVLGAGAHHHVHVRRDRSRTFRRIAELRIVATAAAPGLAAGLGADRGR